jgi:hypothetical protein
MVELFSGIRDGESHYVCNKGGQFADWSAAARATYHVHEVVSIYTWQNRRHLGFVKLRAYSIFVIKSHCTVFEFMNLHASHHLALQSRHLSSDHQWQIHVAVRITIETKLDYFNLMCGLIKNPDSKQSISFQLLPRGSEYVYTLI